MIKNSKLLAALACLTIGAMCSVTSISLAQTPANLSPGLQEIVKLNQAQMGDDVIVAYIKNTGSTFRLTADDMLYLKGQGVSPTVISALLPPSAPIQPTVAPAPSPSTVILQQPASQPVISQPAPMPGPPPAGGPEVSLEYFHQELSPFGTWVNVDGVMYWRPDQALAANPDWRPYYDMGRWVQTDNGLFWESDYKWGDIPFHYGRWVQRPGMGWIWAPDLEWGPSWVFWRHGEVDAAIGWAPLPFGAVVVDGGYMYNGVRVGLDFEFGLGEAAFTFVAFDHFHEPFFRMRGREFVWHVRGERFHEFYHHSVVRNEFHRDEHGRFVNNGIGRSRIEAATHGKLAHENFEERHPVGDHTKPAAHTTAAASKHSSTGTSGKEPGHTATGNTAAGSHSGTSSSGNSASSSGGSKIFRPPASSTPPKTQSGGSGGKKTK